MILWNNPLPTRLKADEVDVSGDGLISGKTGEDMFFQIKPKHTAEENEAQFSATNCQVTFEGIFFQKKFIAYLIVKLNHYFIFFFEICFCLLDINHLFSRSF